MALTARIIIINAVLFGTVYSNTCSSFKISKENINTALIGHSILAVNDTNHYNCAQTCMAMSVCKSIDFDRNEHVCKLNDVDQSSVDPSEFETKQGSIFSDISEWPSSMVGSCGSRPCKANQRCYQNGASHVCKDIITLPSDCKEILDKDPEAESGQYEIELWKSGKILTLNCDMETEGGGWTLFQRRIDGSVDFYRNFTEYENGFGNVDGEFWLGLKYIQELAEQGSTEVRLDMTRSDSTTGHETCQDFMLTEGTNYEINIGSCTHSGMKNTFNAFPYNDDMPFTTYDRDLDSSNVNCAVKCHGAWWYRSCSNVNLNGYYATLGTACEFPGAERGYCGHIHYTFDDIYSLRTSSMMIRRK